MNLRKNILFAFAICILIASCKDKKKDAEPKTSSVQLSADDSKELLKRSGQNLTSDIISFTQNEGAEAISNLSNLLASAETDPINGVLRQKNSKYRLKSIYKDRTKNFRTLFLPDEFKNGRKTDDGAFDFNSNKGVYEWDSQNEDFKKTGSSQYIVMKFPSVKNSSVNDAALTLYKYSEEKSNDEYGYNPTEMQIDLKINNVKYLSLDYTATFKNDIPVKMTYTLYLKPYTNSVNFDDAGAKTAITASILKDGESQSIIKTTFALEYTDSNKEELKALSGDFVYRELKTDFHANIQALENASQNEDFEARHFNDNITIVVRNSSNSEAGKIIAQDSNSDIGVDFLIQFTDGSTTSVESYFDNAITELENYITSLSNE